MDALYVLIGILLAVALGIRWLYKRQREVDDYYDREPADLPISDVTHRLGGGD